MKWYTVVLIVVGVLLVIGAVGRIVLAKEIIKKAE